MHSKGYRLKCLLLAVFVLCTGMYAETFKEVSRIPCAPVFPLFESVLAQANTFDEAQLCTVETAGIQTADRQVLEKSTNDSKQVLNPVLEFLCSECFLLQRESISLKPDRAESDIPGSREVIAGYIHKSDGKK